MFGLGQSSQGDHLFNAWDELQVESLIALSRHTLSRVRHLWLIKWRIGMGWKGLFSVPDTMEPTFWKGPKLGFFWKRSKKGSFYNQKRGQKGGCGQNLPVFHGQNWVWPPRFRNGRDHLDRPFSNNFTLMLLIYCLVYGSFWTPKWVVLDPQMGRFGPPNGYLLRFDPFQTFHQVGLDVWLGSNLGSYLGVALWSLYRAMTYLFTCRAKASASDSEPTCGLDNDLIGGASDAALYLSTKC
jgi:hypothetical protein